MTRAVTKITANKAAKFLDCLAEMGNVTEAARHAGVGRTALYWHRNNDANFRALWDEALELGVAALEDEANRRAFIGVEEPVFYQGQQCGTVRKFSDTLLIFLLKAQRPEKYRENFKLEHSLEDQMPTFIINLADVEEV